MVEPERAVTDLSQFRNQRPPMGEAEARPLPTGTVTFLLTDIEGSARRWEQDGPAMAAAVARHYEILDAAVAAHGGVRPIEQGEGDSLVATFTRPSDAAGAALDAQLTLLEEEWPEGIDLVVRMALHTGEAQIRDGRYYVGPSIIRCARLRSLAHGGQVLISNPTADLLADGLPRGTALLPLGLHRLRDLRQPERVFQLAHPNLPDRFPPLRSLEALPNNLPAQVTSFVGREIELAELTELLGGNRLVTLVGAGGCGKTRLAVQLAAEVAAAHPDGVWWAELATVSDAQAVPRAVMSALGILDARNLDPLERMIGVVADQQVLLALDNCEHVLEPVATLVEGLLRSCPQLVVLATSREPLAVPGEMAWRVPALSLPSETEIRSADAALGSEAVRLFVERAALARPTFRIDDDNASALAAICSRLDGLPLAIELAAARVRSLSPARILDGLGDRFRLLTGGTRMATGRQQTLQASVEWSHDLLGPDERVLLRRLAVFSGSFSLEAAEEICAGDPIENWEVLTLLSDLVDKSLVVFDGERYRLLQTIHDFARAQLLASGEADVVRDRHCAWFAARAEQAADTLEGAGLYDILQSLEHDHDNLRAALGWMESRGDWAAVRALLSSLTLFWTMHGHFSEYRESFRAMLDALPADASAQRGWAVWGLGHLRLWSMDLPGGYGMIEADLAAALARQIDDPALLARALTDQGLLTGFAAPAAGVAILEQAVESARRAGDGWSLAGPLAFLAFHRIFHQDRPDLAEPLLDELAGLTAGGEIPGWRAWHQLVSGVGWTRQGRLAEARAALEAASASGWKLADPSLESWSAAFLSDVQIAQGDYRAAQSTITRSVSWQCRSAFCRAEWVQSQLAVLALARGDFAEVHTQVAAVGPSLRAAGIPFLIVTLGLLTARAALGEGDPATARAAVEEAVPVAGHLELPWLWVAVHGVRGRLARAEGNAAAAEDWHHKALGLGVAHRFRGLVAETLEALGGLAAAGDSHAEASRLLGAAHALREATGHARPPVDQPGYDADVASLRSHLGTDSFEAAWKEGAGLSLEEVAAYASRARGERKRPSTGWAALTPTELEVVALAAQGLSNAEIGRHLFITAGTAKVHLSHIYAKLGIANRAQLAAEATARAAGNR